MNEGINQIGLTLLIYSIIFLTFSGAVYLFQKDKIYRGFPQGWLDIKTHKIPKDIRHFIATDGKKVEVLSSCTWGPYGEIYFSSYDKSFVTHWQPLPDVPK